MLSLELFSVTVPRSADPNLLKKTAPLRRKTVRVVLLFAMKLLDGILQGLAGLEGRHLRRGDLDGLAGARVAAGTSGKLKTVMQIIAILICLLFGQGPLLWNIPLSTWLVGIAAIVTVYSGVEYIVKNWDMIEMK